MPWVTKARFLVNGSPNGSISGQMGDIAQDTTGGTGLWVCANGGTVWTNLAGAGTTTLTGDVTGSGTGSIATTIAANAVTNAKAAQMAANTIKGNNTGGLANAVDLTAAQTKTLLAIAEADVTNLVSDLAAKAPIASPTFTGITTAPEFSASGLTGATAASRYVGATASGAPTSGTFAVGDFIIDQTGKLFVCTVAGTPGTWVQVGGGASTTALLTQTNYNPVTLATYSSTTASMADLDATNLIVTFTTPSTGNVIVVLEGTCQCVANTAVHWGLREATTNITGTDGQRVINLGAAIGDAVQIRSRTSFALTGLTAGSHTYKWAQENKTPTGTISTFAGGIVGAAVMQVWSTP